MPLLGLAFPTLPAVASPNDGGAAAPWLIDYFLHIWHAGESTHQSPGRAGCEVCVDIVRVQRLCGGGGGNTVRRRRIESRFIHHCDSWSRSNTTFQVTSWSHFWRMSCEGSFDRVTLRGAGPLRIPVRTRNTHVCPQTPIWFWELGVKCKIWSFLVFFVFFFTRTTRPADIYFKTNFCRLFFFLKSRPFLWVDLRRGWMPFQLGSQFFIVKKGKLVIGEHLTVLLRETLLWL